jgi:hypothetical protein
MRFRSEAMQVGHSCVRFQVAVLKTRNLKYTTRNPNPGRTFAATQIELRLQKLSENFCFGNL